MLEFDLPQEPRRNLDAHLTAMLGPEAVFRAGQREAIEAIVENGSRALVVGTYLPLSFKSPKEQEYIDFLWDAFETNYAHGKYQFAFLAYHMLTMSFVYFNIWQIKQTQPRDFEKALIGFAREESTLLTATSPFVFSAVSERTILRLLRLIACNNAEIGTYAKLVDDRNDSAHSNGNIFFSTGAALDSKITEILRIVDEIERHSEAVIEQCYRDFLLQNQDPDVRAYPDAADQIREVLIHENYLSQRDIEICLAFDLTQIQDLAVIAEVRALHEALRADFEAGEPD